MREALDHAIDKQAIVDTVTFGIGKVAHSYIPEGALYHNKDNSCAPYDPEKAKQMLKDAGREGLTLNHIVNAGDTVDEQIAILVQQQLAKAGVTLNIQKMDPEPDLADSWLTAITIPRSITGRTTSSIPTRRRPSCSATMPT